RRIAQSESGLRVAAKYGWIYFCIIVLILLSPLTVLLTRRRYLRILGVSISIYCSVVFAFNGLFELSHAWSTFSYFPVLMLLSEFGWKAKGKIRQMKEHRGHVPAI